MHPMHAQYSPASTTHAVDNPWDAHSPIFPPSTASYGTPVSPSDFFTNAGNTPQPSLSPANLDCHNIKSECQDSMQLDDFTIQPPPAINDSYLAIPQFLSPAAFLSPHSRSPTETSLASTHSSTSTGSTLNMSVPPSAIELPESEPRPLQSPKTPRRKMNAMTAETRKQLCEYAAANPSLKQETIARKYGVDRSTVSKILKDKARWMAPSKIEEPVEIVKKNPKGRFPDLENQLISWCRAEWQQKKTWPGDVAIANRALLLADELDMQSIAFKASPRWIESFKKRHRLEAVASSSSTVPTIEEDEVPVTQYANMKTVSEAAISPPLSAPLSAISLDSSFAFMQAGHIPTASISPFPSSVLSESVASDSYFNFMSTSAPVGMPSGLQPSPVSEHFPGFTPSLQPQASPLVPSSLSNVLSPLSNGSDFLQQDLTSSYFPLAQASPNINSPLAAPRSFRRASIAPINTSVSYSQLSKLQRTTSSSSLLSGSGPASPFNMMAASDTSSSLNTAPTSPMNCAPWPSLASSSPQIRTSSSISFPHIPVRRATVSGDHMLASSLARDGGEKVSFDEALKAMGTVMRFLQGDSARGIATPSQIGVLGELRGRMSTLDAINQQHRYAPVKQEAFDML